MHCTAGLFDSTPRDQERQRPDPNAEVAETAEIAEEIGTSQMQVSRVLSRLMIKMRSIIGIPDELPAAS